MPRADIHALSMYYEVAGDGVPLLMIAGLGGDHVGWMESQVPAYTAAGYRCVMPDNRDAGQTQGAPLAAYDIRQLADDASALMATLGLASAHVFGTSMGGMIAQELALAHPERCRSLTLVCTAPAIDPYMREQLSAWRAARPKATLLEFCQMFALWLFTYRFFQAPGAMQAFLQEVAAFPYPQSVESFVRQCDAVLTHDATSRLGGLSLPTHVIVGAEDLITPPRHSRALCESIPGAKLSVIAEAGHGLFWERRDEFNRAVLGFLRQH